MANYNLIVVTLAVSSAAFLLLGGCKSPAPEYSGGVERTAATRRPQFDDEELKAKTYRFVAERNDMLDKGEAFFPDTSAAKECDVSSPALERLFFGSTRADWAKSGMAITKARVAVLDGTCAAGGISGPANVVVTYGFAQGGPEPTETRWFVGDFGPEGMTSGVHYTSSRDMGEQNYAIAYLLDEGRSLTFEFTRKALRTLLDEPVAAEQIARTVFEGEEQKAVVHLMAGVRHGLSTRFDPERTETCYVLGEKAPRPRCDGAKVPLEDGEQAQLDALIAARHAGAAPVVARRDNGNWPALEPLMKATGGGENDAAVVVGVEDYAYVADVIGAAQNAQDWYRYFTKVRGVPAASVKLLVDDQGTDDQIRDAVTAAASRVGEGGSLWFVFIGHGAPAKDQKGGLLVGVDAQQTAKGLYGRSVSQDDVIALAARGKQAETVLVVDACFSGRNEGGALAPGLQPMLAVSMTVADPRTLVFSAGKSDQFAGSLPKGARPAFSYLMLGGLLGWGDADADGVLGSRELITYARDALASVLVGRDQTPELLPDRAKVLGRSAGAVAPDLTQVVLGD